MRVPVLFLALLALALFVAGCGGPDNATEELSAACERQIEEVEAGAHEGDTPTAKSTEERLAKVTLIECAGQTRTVEAADAETDEGEGEEKAAEEEGAEGEEPAAGEGEGEEPAGAPAALDPAARTMFVDTCGSCHTLSDAETSGAVGPNLDDTTMDAAAVEQQIINGGGAMPAGLLEGADATSVAEYVAGAAAAG